MPKIKYKGEQGEQDKARYYAQNTLIGMAVAAFADFAYDICSIARNTTSHANSILATVDSAATKTVLINEITTNSKAGAYSNLLVTMGIVDLVLIELSIAGYLLLKKEKRN